MAALAKSLKVAIETAQGQMMDMSGFVKDVEISADIGGQIETNLTLVGDQSNNFRYPDGPGEVWNLPENTKSEIVPDIASQIRKVLEELYPREVVVECQNCGQWGAKKTQCKYCGGPVG